MRYIVKLNSVNSSDAALVGGKNASIGEMLQNLSALGIKVPNGFATTTHMYTDFIKQGGLDKRITAALAHLDTKNVTALKKIAKNIRTWILATPFPPEFTREISAAYAELKNAAVAVRSSATAEDLETASFAGQQETFLNIRGAKNVIQAIKMVYASLFTSRAISYRYRNGFDSDKVYISVGVQPMVRSDKAVSGVMFTLDTESGFDKVILVSAAYGLGEGVVQGLLNPDEFIVSKPLLASGKLAILQRHLGDKTVKVVYADNKQPGKTIKIAPVSAADQLRYCLKDEEINKLANYALKLEKHYGSAIDIEWAKDGVSGEIYILQVRQETVKSKQKQPHVEQYHLTRKGKLLATGQSIGQRIGKGKAKVILDPKNMQTVQAGDILVTDMTDPDWEPVMKRAGAIVTNRGGRTCHAAIVARELGIPAVIGCGNATKIIKNGMPVTVSCAEGQEGYVYEGELPYEVRKISVESLPKLPLKICINMGTPDKAFATQCLPNDGVGLARLEFIISNSIGIHPNALLNFDKLPKVLKQKISRRIAAYASPTEFYIEKLREGISTIAAAFYPKEVIFRFSDFKSNEYANLLGGELYEPVEENPMIGYRGACRYRSKDFAKAFSLECQAFLRVRNKMGLTNTTVMVPFVRTVNELQDIIKVLAANGMKRGVDGLKIYMMCEIPSNALLASEFLKYVDGFSIGSNDLTQLTLGIDRDSSLVADLFDERNEAVKMLLRNAIHECNRAQKYIGICGQAPSDYPDFAQWLMAEGIGAISLNPDTIIETWLHLGNSKDKANDILTKLKIDVSSD